MAIPFRKSKGLLQLRLQPRLASNIPSRLGLQSICKASTKDWNSRNCYRMGHSHSNISKHAPGIQLKLSFQGLKDSRIQIGSSLFTSHQSNQLQSQKPAMPTTTFQPRHVTPPPPRNGATLRGHGSDAKNYACLVQALSKVVPKTVPSFISESLFVHQCFLRIVIRLFRSGLVSISYSSSFK